ncbi:MAG: class I tRNA ligase family protein, partial [Candidatus Dependentiae bacterium]|nr:class I tRNA ligase family protein [Candidatus Dependentiae bacterium]
DRLYVEKADGNLRRSAQTVCYHILHTMTTVMAPILSMTAEQIFDEYRTTQDSIHLQDFADTQTLFEGVMRAYRLSEQPYLRHAGDDSASAQSEFMAAWDKLSLIRSTILKALENLREQGVIKHSLDAALRLHVSPEFAGFKDIEHFLRVLSGQTPQAFFKEYCIVSQVEMMDKPDSFMLEVFPGVFLAASKAAGAKCNRCWQWSTDCRTELSGETAGDGLCGRCAAILKP